MNALFNAEPFNVLPYDGSAQLHEGFMAPEEADQIFDRLHCEIPWETHHLIIFGKRVVEPRLSAWIADSGIAYTYSNALRQPLPWTRTLSEVRERVSHLTNTPFNSVLANLYRDGNDAMGWHSDDEPCNGPEPVIASVSLGATRRFDFRHKVTKEKVSVLLPHGSLLVMAGRSQGQWQHRIARTARVSDPRINLTFRNVIA